MLRDEDMIADVSSDEEMPLNSIINSLSYLSLNPNRPAEPISANNENQADQRFWKQPKKTVKNTSFTITGKTSYSQIESIDGQVTTAIFKGPITPRQASKLPNNIKRVHLTNNCSKATLFALPLHIHTITTGVNVGAFTKVSILELIDSAKNDPIPDFNRATPPKSVSPNRLKRSANLITQANRPSLAPNSGAHANPSPSLLSRMSQENNADRLQSPYKKARYQGSSPSLQPTGPTNTFEASNNVKKRLFSDLSGTEKPEQPTPTKKAHLQLAASKKRQREQSNRDDNTPTKMLKNTSAKAIATAHTEYLKRARYQDTPENNSNYKRIKPDSRLQKNRFQLPSNRKSTAPKKPSRITQFR